MTPCSTVTDVGNALAGIDNASSRGLTFCWEGKPYTIAPSKAFCYTRMYDITAFNQTPNYYHFSDAKAAVWGYDSKGYRCVHNIVEVFRDNPEHCDRVYGSLVCFIGYTDACDCCLSARNFPVGGLLGEYGLFRPIGVWPSTNMLLAMETTYFCRNEYKIAAKCYNLDQFMQGNLVPHSDSNCKICMPCFGNQEACYTCISNFWLSMAVTPNYNFDTCSVPLLIAGIDPLGTPTTGCLLSLKLSKNPNYDNGSCSAGETQMMCCAQLRCSLGVTSTITTWGGSHLCTDACRGARKTGNVIITGNNEFVAVTGICCINDCCFQNKIIIYRDCDYDSGSTLSYTPILNCSFNFCHNQSNPRWPCSNWSWDCAGCHFAYTPCIGSQIGLDCTQILSRNSTKTGYVVSYCQSICINRGSPCLCAIVWPRYCTGTTMPTLLSIDISGDCHCIYSGNASCITTTPEVVNGCGLNYDAGTCTWQVGTQQFCNTCGSNTAPNLLWGWGCDNVSLCCCGACCNQPNAMIMAQLQRDADGYYMNPMAIHPLSNTELYSI
jgi:hypothetical protein